jgi:hypothetical protein
MKITAGTTSYILDIFVQDSSSTAGAGLAGLVYNTASLTAKYKRQGSATWTTISLATATAGTWASGGFIAAGSADAGDYELHLPDAAIASGVAWVAVSLQGAANMAPTKIRIGLTATNDQDAVRAGMTALPDAAADAAGGLPVSDAGALDLDALNTAVNAIPTTPMRGTDSAALAATALSTAVWTGVPTGFLAATFPTTLASTTNITGGTITTVGTCTTNSDMRGTDGANTVVPDAAGTIPTGMALETTSQTILTDTGTTIPALIPTAGAIADQVWDEATVGHTTSGTYGGRVVRSTNSNVEVQITGSNHIAADVHEFQTGVITAADFATDAITAAALAADAVTEIQSGLALETSVQSTLDRLGFTLAALAGNCADPQTAAETYSIILGANTFTIDHTGLDATGTRTTATLTKS